MNINPTENEIQIAVMQWINLHPDIRDYVFHIPNEGKRSPRTGALMKSMGLRSGVSDLIIAVPSRGFHGAFIELKTKRGSVTASQRTFLDKMDSKGYFACVCFGLDDSIARIKWYLNL